MTTFELNGTTVTTSDDHPHLLSALRDELDVLSPKDGCAPSGQCGCCTVLLNGKARIACQTSMEKAEGASVVTLEGLDPAERDRYAAAFAAHGALQCGFCTPGIVMSLVAACRSGTDAATAKKEVLDGHLCRCTGYVNIRAAIDAAWQATGGERGCNDRGGGR